MLCAVSTCRNNNKKNKNNTQTDVCFYSFPRDSIILKMWVDFCKRKELFDTQTSRICSEHFTPNDFERNFKFEMGFTKKNTRKLKPGSVPTEYKEHLIESFPNEQNLRKIKDLQQENCCLKLNEKKLQHKIKSLEMKLKKSDWRNKNMETKLKSLFTTAQINKLMTGKRLCWSLEDVEKSINLYSAGSRAYKLLVKQKYPLPSIRTLHKWMQMQKNNLKFPMSMSKVLVEDSEDDSNKTPEHAELPIDILAVEEDERENSITIEETKLEKSDVEMFIEENLRIKQDEDFLIERLYESNEQENMDTIVKSEQTEYYICDDHTYAK